MLLLALGLKEITMPIMMAIRIKLNVGVRRTADGPWGCGGIRAHAVLWMDGRPRIPFEWGAVGPAACGARHRYSLTSSLEGEEWEQQFRRCYKQSMT